MKHQTITQQTTSPICVIAIHNGKIEPGTGLIARTIAQGNHSFFVFTGTDPSQHVPSEQFSHPELSNLLQECQTVISIHGQASTDQEFVMVGGLDKELGARIERSLQEAGHICKKPPKHLGGTHPQNVCNKGQRGKGVQLEISRRLRTHLWKDPDALDEFCAVIRSTLQ
jgi:phage replication-related protein YjqB (UPF0714/DUF867 family)